MTGTEGSTTPLPSSSLPERLFESAKKRKASSLIAKNAYPSFYDEMAALLAIKAELRDVYYSVQKRDGDKKLTKALEKLVGLFQAFSDIYMVDHVLELGANKLEAAMFIKRRAYRTPRLDIGGYTVLVKTAVK